MSVDNDQILPDEKTRHWMVAQTHLLYEESADQRLERETLAMQAADPDFEAFRRASDVQKDRAKKAFDVIQSKVEGRDLNSDNLFEDLLSEKAYQLDRVSICISKILNFFQFQLISL